MAVFRTFQSSVANRLSSQPFLAGVPIVVDSKKEIQTEIQTAISKLGVCVIVVTPTASMSSPNAPAPYFERVKLILRVVEQPTINRSAGGLGLTAYDVAEFVAIALHSWSPFEEDSSTVQDVNTTVVVDTITTVPDKSFLVIDVNAHTSFGIDSKLLLTPPSYTLNNNNPIIRFTLKGVLQIQDSSTSTWYDIGLQNGQLFLLPQGTYSYDGTIRFAGGSLQMLDSVLNAWMTLGAQNGQLFVDPTNAHNISNITFTGGTLNIYDSVLLKYMNLGVQNGQLVLT